MAKAQCFVRNLRFRKGEMQVHDFHAFYWAGIGVTAHKFGIRVHKLSLGDEYGLNGEASLEPISEWCDLDDERTIFHATGKTIWLCFFIIKFIFSRHFC